MMKAKRIYENDVPMIYISHRITNEVLKGILIILN